MSRNIFSLLLAMTMLIIYTNGYSQGVAISETNAPPDPSAMLDVESTTRGFLPPRLTSAQRAAILAPASGLLVFDTDFNALFVMTGEGWMRVDYGDKWLKDEDNNLTYNLGKVGIGVSYPVTELEIDGQIKINGGGPGAGKVLTSDAAGTATWLNTPMSILGTAQSSGYSNITSDFSFFVPPAMIELPEAASIMIHSSRGLGTTTGINASGTLSLYICYRNTNGGFLQSIGGGILGLRLPANTRIPFSLSYSTPLLPAGIYEVGLCGLCYDPAQWNSNEYSYTSAMAYKLPAGTTGLSFNTQNSAEGNLSRNPTEENKSSAPGNSPVVPVAGSESPEIESNTTIEERIEQLSRENESIKTQLNEISRIIESGASSSSKK
ncbi:MAG: hypothetical protein IPH20_04775 [Bacteroidales bacterium]|nr:hypothetical protein [Bacteroidales bacterium]